MNGITGNITFRMNLLESPEFLSRYELMPEPLRQKLQEDIIKRNESDRIEREKNRPGSYETWQQLADVIITGDVSLYKPTLKPNSHWSNWPESGSDIIGMKDANEKVSYQEDFTLLFMFDLLTPETDIAVMTFRISCNIQRSANEINVRVYTLGCIRYRSMQIASWPGLRIPDRLKI